MNLIKSDNIGVIASSLCIIHCVATPFLFVVHSCCSVGAPSWWQSFDFLFLAISLIAIYFSVKNSTSNFVIFGMWFSWFLLGIILLNNRFSLFAIDHNAIYIPAALLIILHIYNLKYCQCSDNTCCAKSE